MVVGPEGAGAAAGCWARAAAAGSSIEIRGNTKTRDKVIRREMKISEGELFSQTLLDLSKRRINALGFFDRVDISQKRGSADDRIEIGIAPMESADSTVVEVFAPDAIGLLADIAGVFGAAAAVSRGKGRREDGFH